MPMWEVHQAQSASVTRFLLRELIIDENVTTAAEITTKLHFLLHEGLAAGLRTPTVNRRMGGRNSQGPHTWKEKCLIYTLCQKIVCATKLGGGGEVISGQELESHSDKQPRENFKV